MALLGRLKGTAEGPRIAQHSFFALLREFMRGELDRSDLDAALDTSADAQLTELVAQMIADAAVIDAANNADLIVMLRALLKEALVRKYEDVFVIHEGALRFADASPPGGGGPYPDKASLKTRFNLMAAD